MSDNKINNTLAMMMKRAFAGMDDEAASALFLQVLRGSDGKDVAREQVRAAIHQVYDQNLGKRLLRKPLNEKVSEILGSEMIASLVERTEKMTDSKHADKCQNQLRILMDDVLSGAEFEGVRGKTGGTYRVCDYQEEAKS